MLLPDAIKEKRLHALGIDLLIVKEFTLDFAAVAADDFLAYLKSQLPTLNSVHVGENFRFGKGRQGDIDQLVETGKRLGVHVYSVQRLRLDGEAISSTRIRTALEEGDTRTANRLLGYPYTSEGCLQPGRQIGRQIGFPTLNFAWEPELKPRFGVYAVRVRRIGREGSIPGVANYGMRPTVNTDDTHPLLEVHLFEMAKFAEAEQLKVEWLSFLRPELKFDGLDALKAQISQDVRDAQDFFKLR